MFDKDGDGEISIKELITVMRSLGLNPTESEIVEIMANLDLDGTHTMYYVEFHEIKGNILLYYVKADYHYNQPVKMAKFDLQNWVLAETGYFAHKLVN